MHIDDRNGVGDQKGWTCWNPREYNIKYICRYQRFGSCGLAEMGFELVVAGVGSLHDAVADDARYDAAEGSEGYEEGLRVPCHADYPTPCLALLPQDRHLSPSLPLSPSLSLALSALLSCLGWWLSFIIYQRMFVGWMPKDLRLSGSPGAQWTRMIRAEWGWTNIQSDSNWFEFFFSTIWIFKKSMRLVRLQF